MKERLIAFTRNEANVRKLNIVIYIIALLIVTMELYVFKKIIIDSILLITFIIIIFVSDFIRGLSKESENVIRNNKLISLFLANPNVIFDFISIIIVLIGGAIIITSLKKVGVYNIVINGPQSIIVLIVLIIFVILIRFIASKISKYFRKILIK